MRGEESEREMSESEGRSKGGGGGRDREVVYRERGEEQRERDVQCSQKFSSDLIFTERQYAKIS